jgi:23S rRNA pseudouridine1911/1915/1917 synthase
MFGFTKGSSRLEFCIALSLIAISNAFIPLSSPIGRQFVDYGAEVQRYSIFSSFHRSGSKLHRIFSEINPSAGSSFFVADAATEGRRLDIYLADKLKTTRGQAGNLCEGSLVTVNKKIRRKSFRLSCGDEVEVQHQQRPEAADAGAGATAASLHVLYEDDDIIIVNKPVGVVCQGISACFGEKSLIDIIADYVGFSYDASDYFDDASSEALGEGDVIHGSATVSQRHPLLVHRLDRGTTGAFVAGKSPASAASLKRLFSQRRVQKYYSAVCLGNPGNTTINQPISRSKDSYVKMKVDCDPGKSQRKGATTHVCVLHSTPRHSLLGVKIETGRTHQIRVHLQHRGCPILGDALYACNNREFSASRFPRPLLHARELRLPHPNPVLDDIAIVAPYPDDFVEAAGILFGDDDVQENLEGISISSNVESSILKLPIS